MSEQSTASLQEYKQPDTTALVHSSAGASSQEPFAQPTGQNRPASYYDYCYPGKDAMNLGWTNHAYPHAKDGLMQYSGSTASLKSRGMRSTVDAKVPRHGDSLLNYSTASSYCRPTFQNPPHRPSGKVPQSGSGYRSAGIVENCYPVSVKNGSSYSNQVQAHYDPFSYRPNGQTWAGYDRYCLGGKFNRNGEFEAARELNRGPRALRGRTSISSSTDNDQLGPRVRRDRYNSQNFQTVHDNAKFFVIKSYSEDDIHKSIKYDVWASTPNGNKKLDAAFHEIESKFSGTCTSCPIFLFFSVNSSGQFVGLAEMVGRVDFKKDMDFWQQDKWSGFFPVKWHVIKDIPNNTLRHIILENNDHKPVTYTRDTQEVGLKQGLEMLSIFKSFREETSMLDDFGFYEDRERSLHARRSSKAPSPEVGTYGRDIPHNNLEAGLTKAEQVQIRSRKVSDSEAMSLVTLTRNLSLISNPPRNNGGRSSTRD